MGDEMRVDPFGQIRTLWLGFIVMASQPPLPGLLLFASHFSMFPRETGQFRHSDVDPP